MVRLPIPPLLRQSSWSTPRSPARSSSPSLPPPTLSGSSVAAPAPASAVAMMKSSPQDANRTPTGLTLKISVIKGRDLAPKDKNGVSDPYLVLTLGDARYVTPAIPKTLNPEWNIVCEMPITGVDSLLFDCVCWDKDRFGKDYMGEFELALEDIFNNDQVQQEASWHPLKSTRSGNKKKNAVSGDIQLQFSIYDAADPDAPASAVLERFSRLARIDPDTLPPPKPQALDVQTPGQSENDDDLDIDEDELPSDESLEESGKATTVEERKKRRLRIKGLKKRQKQLRSYELSGSGRDVVGIIFLEINKITDLPPERNMTRTSFDMDPFVVASLGKKTYRTRVVRHNLNPVFNEKMMFQVLRNEQNYSLSFTVIDRDTLSGNDFIASCFVPVPEIIATAPKADAETGLYVMKEPTSVSAPQQSKSRFRLPISRSSSSTSLAKLGRPALTPRSSNHAVNQVETPASSGNGSMLVPPPSQALESAEDPDVKAFVQPLKLKKEEKWEEKHSPELYIRAKYLPYPAIRQQFWRAMLKQYDVDENGCISKVELTTMLDSLGSTLKESTIDGFFQRFSRPANGDEPSLSFDEAVICLEDELYSEKQLQHSDASPDTSATPASGTQTPSPPEAATSVSGTTLNERAADPDMPLPVAEDFPVDEGDLGKDDLNDRGAEHVVVIRECPICHQPRLNRRSDADIITHVATCASQDWRQINNLVMGGFVTSSQAQRKWYSKVITKISYGGYKLGANSANILVQDRITGQINEERMSVYVRLGIRLLYKGLKSRDMENKRIRKLLRSLSVKQGVKFDDPASKAEIQKFIAFHQLDMSEVLLPIEEFKNFNEFFYRALTPTARPCSAPHNPKIIVSPADCRSVVFNKVDDATRIWIKGREFSIERLLGSAYPEDVKRFTNGALGIFRLAPQDYHRFHIPVDGVLGEPRTIDGEYYTVNPMAIRSALDVYGENVRVLVPIDSTTHGRVMAVCVGAMMVGSTIITRKPGEKVSRAEELGYFKFGGSTVVLLFEPGTMVFDDDLVNNSTGALETLIRVGMSIGHSPDEKQHEPDMQKDAADVSAAEIDAAKVRIAGMTAESSGITPPTASLAG